MMRPVSTPAKEPCRAKPIIEPAAMTMTAKIISLRMLTESESAAYTTAPIPIRMPGRVA